MKILIANCHFAPDSFGGATVVAEETATRLADRGHDVVVFTSTSDGDLETHQLFRYESAGIPVVAIKVPERRTLRSEYDDPGVTRQFKQLLDAMRPDVVHVHAIQALGVGILRAAQERGIPTVVTVHDAWWLCERQFMVRATGEFCDQSAIDARVCATCVPDPGAHQVRQQTSLELLNRCDRVLAPSVYWRDLLVASGVRADIAAVNSNGVSRPRPGWRRSPRRGPVRLGYVGALSPAKGYPQLVDALRMLQRSDYELVVVDSFSTLGFVTMNLADMEFQTLLDTRHSKTYQLARNAWCGDYNEASTFLSLLDSKSEQNDQGYANADVDAWLAESKTSADPNVQYAEVEAQAAKDVPIMPIYFYAKVFMQSSNVKGWPFEDVEQNWYAKDLYKVAE